jgi:CDGSH-type Zn-finger protein
MASTRITVNNNGSLKIEGDFEIVDMEGRAFGLGGRTKVSLCRCGQSANKPFCDSAHKRCSFESLVVAFDLPAPQPKPAE